MGPADMRPVTRSQAQRVFRHGLLWIMIGVISHGYLMGLAWEEPRLALSTLIDGTAHRPFVYRVLVPTLIGWAQRAVPLPAPILAAGLIVASFYGFVLAFRSLASTRWSDPDALDVASFGAVVCLTPFLLTSRHVYDLPALFLFTLGLRLQVARNWRWYFVIFALACLNKETAILLTVIDVVSDAANWRRIGFWRRAGAQALIFGLIRLCVMWRFASNPGVSVEPHLADHLLALQVAPLMVGVFALGGVLALGMAMAGWHDAPPWLRRGTLAVVPLLLGAFFAWGYPFEIRNLLEAYPLIVLLALPATRLPLWARRLTEAFHARSRSSIT